MAGLLDKYMTANPADEAAQRRKALASWARKWGKGVQGRMSDAAQLVRGLLDTGTWDRAATGLLGLDQTPEQRAGRVQDVTNQFKQGMSPEEYDKTMNLALNINPVLATVWHGSPHKFDKFDMSKIGTGEGKQQQGVGLYFAEKEAVAQRYADRLADMHGKAEGNLYKVDLPDDAVRRLADYEGSFASNPDSVRQAMTPLLTDDVVHNLRGYYGWENVDDAPMAAIMGALDISNGNSRAAVTELMKGQGIPGIRYLDGSSRTAGQGTSNYVLFDDRMPRILEKNGQPTGLLSYADESKKAKK